MTKRLLLKRATGDRSWRQRGQQRRSGGSDKEKKFWAEIIIHFMKPTQQPVKTSENLSGR